MELAQHPWSTSLQAGAAILIQLFPLPSCVFASPFLWDQNSCALHPGQTDNHSWSQGPHQPLTDEVGMCISVS